MDLGQRDVVTVPWVKPIFKYGVAFCAAIAFGTFLYQVLNVPDGPSSWRTCMVVASFTTGVNSRAVFSRRLTVFLLSLLAEGLNGAVDFGSLCMWLVVQSLLCFFFYFRPSTPH